MPVKLRWTLRSEEDGRCRTVSAGSPRSALKKYLAEHDEAPGGVWFVKQYGINEPWEEFKVRG